MNAWALCKWAMIASRQVDCPCGCKATIYYDDEVRRITLIAHDEEAELPTWARGDGIHPEDTGA